VTIRVPPRLLACLNNNSEANFVCTIQKEAKQKLDWFFCYGAGMSSTLRVNTSLAADAGQQSGPSSVASSGSTRRVQWDEGTIAEHDKERGTRMKIDEPKTPYHASTQEWAGDDDDIPFLDVSGLPKQSSVVHGKSTTVILQEPPPFRNSAAAAQLAAKPKEEQVLKYSSDNDDDGEDHKLNLEQVMSKLEEERKRKEFESARKVHYKAVSLKQLRQMGTDDEDED